MSARLFLTISAVLGILYGLAFVLIPTQTAPIYGVPTDPHTILEIQFFGSALIMLGAIFWFARDFRDWDAVRGVLIATAIGSVVGGGVNLVGTFEGLLNGMAWTTTVVYALLIVGSLYCLSSGPEASPR
jgi:hypothetical protein